MLQFGANAVSIGSALFQNEEIINKIGKELMEFLKSEKSNNF